MCPQNVGEDVARSATHVDQLCEAAEGESRRDSRALWPVDPLHEMSHRLAALCIGGNILKEGLSVHSGERRIARLENLFQFVPSAQYRFVIQNQGHFA